MDDFLQRVLAFSEKYNMLPRGSLVLCAVSGGADSMCLLRALAELSRTQGFSVAAAHFNHRLRGAASDTDEAFVRRFCAENGIAAHFGSGDVAGESRLRRTGTEETARSLRYDFLERTADSLGADRIATAHNAEDNAETVLMNLVRGSALSGLAGIPPVRGRIVRPLLRTGREEILVYLSRESIPYVEDATNADTLYTRNKFRHLLFPLLREVNPRATEAIGRAALLAGEDDAFLYSLAERAVETARSFPGGLVISADRLESLPSVVAARAILLLTERITGRRGAACHHLEMALSLIGRRVSSASCALPGKVWLRREYGLLFLTLGRQKPTFPLTRLSPDGSTALMGGLWEISCSASPAGKQETDDEAPLAFYVKRDMIKKPLCARPRQAGDRIRLPGRNGSRSLKRLFIDEKVPLSLRETVPVIVDGDQVVAVAGFGADAAYAALPGEGALGITIKGVTLDE